MSYWKKEETENIKLKTTNTIEVNEFIDSKDFDPIFIEKNYYIGPDLGKKRNETSQGVFFIGQGTK